MIKPEKWDFSSCPPEELFHCWMWEYSRECRGAIEEVAGFRDAKGGNGFDDLWPEDTAKALFDGGCPPWSETFFSCSPEWPGGAYMAIPSAERRRRIELAPTGLVTLDEVAIKKLSHFWPPSGRFQSVAFEIDWAVRNERLVNQFREWLKNARPKDV